MKEISEARSNDQEIFIGGEYSVAPVTCTDYFIQRYKGINYYLIDLRQADWNRIMSIVRGCEHVESQCWKAQENFFLYLRKCDVLSYAEKDGQIIAFDAVTLLNSRRSCVYSNDETMVLKEFRGRDIARKLVVMTLEWYFAKTTCLKGIKYFVFTSISANPRVVNGYFKNSWSRIFFDCSFKPSTQLIALMKEYCGKHKISPVHESYPFCMKNLFPGSNNFDPNDPKFQFSEGVKTHMPPGFDNMARGDAFAFMLKVPLWAARIVVLILMMLCFGKGYLTTKGVGLFSPRRQAALVHTERWSLKNAEHAMRMIPERSKAGRRVSAS